MPHVFRSIFHPTSFSGSQDAFAHALRIALAARGELRLLHVNSPRQPPDFDPFPHMRETLARWGMIAPDVSEDEVAARLGLRVSKNLVWDDNLRAAIFAALDKASPDLVVLSLADRAGSPGLLQNSVAETVARSAGRAALCVRRGGGGFVSEETGAITLKSILVPVGVKVPGARAFDTALSLCDLLESDAPDIHVLRVGGEVERDPDLFAPRARFHFHSANGPVVQAILAFQNKLAADLVCMPVRRSRGLVASMVDGVAERVLRAAACPVLLSPSY